MLLVISKARITQHLGIDRAREHLHRKNFFNALVKAQKAEGLARFEINDPNAADALAQLLRNRQTTKNRCFANFREANKGERSPEINTARKARQLGDGLPGTPLGINLCQGATAGLEYPQHVAIPAR